MEKEIEINGQKYIAKEITYMQGVSLEECKTSSEKIKKILMFSTGLTSEEVEKLSFKDGVAIQQVVNEVNGFTATFQKPIVEEKVK